MQGLGRSLNSPAAGGNFEQQHSSCILVASRALKAGKTFISVASTVKLILVTLPATARSERVPLIDAQIAKAKGTDLPRNLQDFLSPWHRLDACIFPSARTIEEHPRSSGNKKRTRAKPNKTRGMDVRAMASQTACSTG
eukprot:8413805-Pyramimonas_sp.AAC.1